MSKEPDDIKIGGVIRIECSLCGEPILYSKSHDIRPIVSNNGNRCCNECNVNIVIPTRKVIWTSYEAIGNFTYPYNNTNKVK